VKKLWAVRRHLFLLRLYHKTSYDGRCAGQNKNAQTREWGKCCEGQCRKRAGPPVFLSQMRMPTYVSGRMLSEKFSKDECSGDISLKKPLKSDWLACPECESRCLLNGGNAFLINYVIAGMNNFFTHFKKLTK
jgi:hypothetical protein